MVLDAAGFQTSNFVDEHGRSRLICGASREGGRRGDHTASRQMGVEGRNVQQAPLAVAAGVPAQALGVRLHDAGPPRAPAPAAQLALADGQVHPDTGSRL